MKKIFRSLLLLPFLWGGAACAQSDVAVGQWKTHFSYLESKDLLQAGNSIYVATSNTLYALDLGDGLYRRLGTTEGLSPERSVESE